MWSSSQPAGGALRHFLSPYRYSENPSEWDLRVFLSSPLVPTPVLTFPANFIHAAPPVPLIFHTYPTCGTRGEKGQGKARTSLGRGLGHLSRVLSRVGWTPGQLSVTTQRQKQTTIDYKTGCCSSAARWTSPCGIFFHSLRSNKTPVIIRSNYSCEFIVTFFFGCLLISCGSLRKQKTFLITFFPALFKRMHILFGVG